RVGADGVLKKPFVPPDPLISMVKSALTRAGVVIGAAEPAAAPPPPPPAAVNRPEPPPLPKLASPPPPAREAERDLDVPLFSPRPTPVAIDKADQPLAFQTLLDAPAEEEPAFTTSDGSAAPERDWGHNADEQEEEHQEESPGNGAWRSSSIEEFPNEAPAGQTDWREAAFAGIGAEKSYKEWAPSVEKNSLSITEDEAAELAKVQQAQASETADGAPEDWSKAINAIFDKPVPASEAATKTEVSPEPAGQEFPAPPAPEPVLSSPAPEEPVEAVPVEPSPALNSWMAGALSPWEAELQRANELSSTWDSLKTEPSVAVDETSPTEAFLNSGLMATAHEHVVEAIEETQAEEDLAARPAEEAPAALESPYLAENEPGELLPSFASVPESVPPAAAPSNSAPAEPNMDELVARVLEKMNPEVLQAVTREILKPVVEALVRDELSKKP
ncbi:MAG TPA: hypothetical protein VKB24_07535, partial [Candidatus Acidoferrum sp.]|nr:hypothetical protein [Candidatus Acidoferrum sp.]